MDTWLCQMPRTGKDTHVRDEVPHSCMSTSQGHGALQITRGSRATPRIREKGAQMRLSPFRPEGSQELAVAGQSTTSPGETDSTNLREQGRLLCLP